MTSTRHIGQRASLRISGFLACVAVASASAFAQPGNDNPCGAEVLTAGATCTYVTWSNVGATGTAGPPAPGCASYSGGDVWFQLVIPPGGMITVTTDVFVGSAFTDGGLAFYTAATCAGPFTLVSCDDDTGPGTMSLLNYTGTPGTTLWIRVWEYLNDASGAFNICATLPPPPAANNDPCQFITLPVNSTCINTAATNVGATATTVPAIPAPGCASYLGGDVWFRVVVPAGGIVTVTTDVAGGSPIFDGGMAFYTSPSCSAGPFTLVSCDDDSGPGAMSALTYTGAPGTVIWVRVWEYGNDSFGAFNICATFPGPPPPPPTNNEPCTATLLTVNPTCGFTTYTNVGATNSTMAPLPACGFFGTGSLDVWFRFVAPPTGIAIIQTQAGSMTDAAMALYQDPPPANCAGPFNLVQCDDDGGAGLMPFLSFTNLTPGTTYYLRVWGYGTGTGSFGLCISGPNSLPAGTCIWALEMYDSFGDGWGSSTVNVSVNGGAFVPYTVVGNFNMILLGLNPGDVLVVTYTASGPGQAENRFELSFFASGLTIFNSGTPPNPGVNYSQAISCNPPPSPPQDCSGGITVCSGQSFGNNANNTGNVVDLTTANQGCLSSGERQGTWYLFSPSAGGTIGFTIAPVVATDYDFAVWGPLSSVVCPPSAPPLRCSFAAPSGNTGCGNGATDLTEGAGGDRWVSTFPVSAGQIYIMYVDNFSSNGQAFNLTWQFGGGASLDCTVLPIELTSFTATAHSEEVALAWTTATERNSDHFEIERSADGDVYTQIGTLPSAGNSTSAMHYTWLDRSPLIGENHYRLRHVDTDGHAQHSSVESVFIRRGGDAIRLVPNPGSGSVSVFLPLADPGSLLLMLDATGKEVYNRRLDGRQVELDTDPLPHGLYAVRLISPSGFTVAYGTWIRE
jgi:hypothetical protein